MKTILHVLHLLSQTTLDTGDQLAESMLFKKITGYTYPMSDDTVYEITKPHMLNCSHDCKDISEVYSKLNAILLSYVSTMKADIKVVLHCMICTTSSSVITSFTPNATGKKPTTMH